MKQGVGNDDNEDKNKWNLIIIGGAFHLHSKMEFKLVQQIIEKNKVTINKHKKTNKKRKKTKKLNKKFRK
jgi:hypothetical protein